MPSIGAYVDLGRVARSLDSYVAQSTHALSKGSLTNIPRALAHERSVLKSVLADAMRDPGAFTGAVDTAAGARLLKSSVDDLTGAIDAAEAAIKAAGRKPRDVVVGTALMPDGTPVTAAIERAAGSVRAASDELGGIRDLPAYEVGPTTTGASVLVADLDSPAVVGRGHRTVQAVARGLSKGVLAPALGVKSAGGSTLPASGRTILAPNHVTNIDWIHAFQAIDRPVRPMAKAGLFDVKGLGATLRAAGAFPVEHGHADTALAHGRAILQRDEALLVYPAGMLHHANGPGAHGVGAATLGAQMGASVTPMGTWGSGPRAVRWTPTGERLPTPLRRPMTSVAFGEPIAPPQAATEFNIGIFRERIARAQEQLVDSARAHHSERVESARRRAPWIAAGGVVAAGSGAALATSR